jgi:hypothetical protein
MNLTPSDAGRVRKNNDLQPQTPLQAAITHFDDAYGIVACTGAEIKSGSQAITALMHLRSVNESLGLCLDQLDIILGPDKIVRADEPAPDDMTGTSVEKSFEHWHHAMEILKGARPQIQSGTKQALQNAEHWIASALKSLEMCSQELSSGSSRDKTEPELSVDSFDTLNGPKL